MATFITIPCRLVPTQQKVDLHDEDCASLAKIRTNELHCFVVIYAHSSLYDRDAIADGSSYGLYIVTDASLLTIKVEFNTDHVKIVSR